jgi:hypothetical protein
MFQLILFILLLITSLQKYLFILGGSSKRLPNLSCTGKLFCPLPLEVEGKAITLLNLKFIITSPFLKLMKNGGIFICASDDIETFCLEGNCSIILLLFSHLAYLVLHNFSYLRS